MMKTGTWFRALALVGTLAAAGCEEARKASGNAAVGDPAPQYAAVSLAGDSVSLAGLRGKVVLLNVWATWCVPCRTEIPALQQIHERHAAQGLELVGVSVDAPGEGEEVRSFVREFGVTYPIWLDPEERVTSTFRLIGVPGTFLIDRKGTLLWKHMGPVEADDPALTRALTKALAES